MKSKLRIFYILILFALCLTSDYNVYSRILGNSKAGAKSYLTPIYPDAEVNPNLGMMWNFCLSSLVVILETEMPNWTRREIGSTMLAIREYRGKNGTSVAFGPVAGSNESFNSISSRRSWGSPNFSTARNRPHRFTGGTFDGNRFGSPLLDFARSLMNLSNIDNGGPRAVILSTMYYENTSVVVTVLAGYRLCEIVGREHGSNNVRLHINFERGVVEGSCCHPNHDGRRWLLDIDWLSWKEDATPEEKEAAALEFYNRMKDIAQEIDYTHNVSARGRNVTL
jgi:hypothetical protein